MAIAFVADRGSVAAAGSSTSVTITGVTCAAGNTLIVPVLGKLQGVSSVSDGTHTFVIDKAFPGSNRTGCIAHWTYAGSFSGTITITFAGAAAAWSARALEFSGIANNNSAADVDTSANNAGGFTTSLSSGAGAALGAAGELGFAAFGVTANNDVLTAGSGYTKFTDTANTDSTLVGEYQIYAGTAAPTATATISGAASYDGALVVYKAAGAVATHYGPYAGKLAMVADLVAEWAGGRTGVAQTISPSLASSIAPTITGR